MNESQKLLDPEISVRLAVKSSSKRKMSALKDDNNFEYMDLEVYVNTLSIALKELNCGKLMDEAIEASTASNQTGSFSNIITKLDCL